MSIDYVPSTSIPSTPVTVPLRNQSQQAGAIGEAPEPKMEEWLLSDISV